ncbi:Hint domain-containing protein [Rhizobium sp. KVB221]|uniref:Hint domain-containing protein n=2 Tax=Rhizobium setariae TaxID=2801340 RepID=A0A936YL54_9HYPH|nr:Hint domain-containing protein [Rhizobium setariae]MBL0372370.1 Hint domain-containing protein [Rhizobium setariae]
MASKKYPASKINRARRHFLGLTAAATARVAAIGVSVSTAVAPSVTQALGRKWWNKGGNTGGGANCFLRGTSIMTSTGEVRIENLRIGDLVQTVRGYTMPIKWIGRQVYRKAGETWPTGALPVCIARHALDDVIPHRDLYLSPRHALLIDGVLIQALDLVNGTSITVVPRTDSDTIEYLHIVLDTHEVILAEGAPAETFLAVANNYERFSNFAEFSALRSGTSHATMSPFAPIVGESGRTHLKALLKLAGFGAPTSELLETAYDRIAERGEKICG